MEIYFKSIGLIDTYLIKGIFISILIIILARTFLKKNIVFNTAVAIIKWVLVFWAILNLASFLVLLFSINSNSYSSSVWKRATGEYGFSYWIMLLGSFSPLFLLFKNLGRKAYFILLVAILTNIGWLFESFVVHVVSIHRDYSMSTNGIGVALPFNRELLVIARGIFFGVLAIIIGNLPFFKIRKNKS
jgi:hypothetical protein